MPDQFFMLSDKLPGFRHEPNGFGEKAFELAVVQRFRPDQVEPACSHLPRSSGKTSTRRPLRGNVRCRARELAMKTVLRHVRRLALMQAGDRATDAHLLQSFLDRRDEAAFEGLLRRHGPMVLGVCRRVLGNVHDAEDAFQATFLVLARKADSVRPREMVGPWLYGVAHRTALKARAMNAKRRVKERRAGELPVPGDGPPEELLARLDEELGRLPERYRVPVVLCELEGRSRKEVAGLLHIPDGTLSSRLAYARKLLARRLSRYGAALSAGSVAALLSRAAASACVPASLLNSTARVAVLTAGVVSARVLALTEGVMKAMLLSKIKFVWAIALAAVVGAGAIGLTHRPAVAQEGPSNAPARSARAAADELEELRLEVAALRKGLEVTRGRVRALEDEVRAIRASAAGARVTDGRHQERLNSQDLDELYDLTARLDAARREAHAIDSPRYGNPAGRPGNPLADAEAALKKLRANPNDKQAADALERALKQLKEREKPELPRINRPHDNVPK
jgi:RNA polymerase sigma factor (sigma-70 family)